MVPHPWILFLLFIGNLQNTKSGTFYFGLQEELITLR